jgi:hypothetical protein
MRQLGSFNRLINTARHPDDWQMQGSPVVARPEDPRLGYSSGLNYNVAPYETPLSTGTGPGMTGAPKRMRMAGDEITLSPGVPVPLPLPATGRAELRVPDLYGQL